MLATRKRGGPIRLDGMKVRGLGDREVATDAAQAVDKLPAKLNATSSFSTISCRTGRRGRVEAECAIRHDTADDVLTARDIGYGTRSPG